jgi:hypothetical protein
MPRPASYPLPLLSASRRPSLLRCDSCFHIGAAVRVGGTLLCGDCFFDVSVSAEAKRSAVADRSSGANAAYDHMA